MIRILTKLQRLFYKTSKQTNILLFILSFIFELEQKEILNICFYLCSMLGKFLIFKGVPKQVLDIELLSRILTVDLE